MPLIPCWQGALLGTGAEWEQGMLASTNRAQPLPCCLWDGSPLLHWRQGGGKEEVTEVRQYSCWFLLCLVITYSALVWFLPIKDLLLSNTDVLNVCCHKTSSCLIICKKLVIHKKGKKCHHVWACIPVYFSFLTFCCLGFYLIST